MQQRGQNILKIFHLLHLWLDEKWLAEAMGFVRIRVFPRAFVGVRDAGYDSLHADAGIFDCPNSRLGGRGLSKCQLRPGWHRLCHKICAETFGLGAF